MSITAHLPPMTLWLLLLNLAAMTLWLLPLNLAAMTLWLLYLNIFVNYCPTCSYDSLAVLYLLTLQP